MNARESSAAGIPAEPLLTCEIAMPQFDLQGWVCIHSVGPRGACGVVRLYPDVTREEVQLLARAMTCKYCFLGYELGGAKAGVTIPFDVAGRRRSAILEEFGRHIGPLLRSRIYYPWTDMNCSVEDIGAIYAGAGKRLKVAPSYSAYYTALSTFSALTAAADHYRMRPEQCRVTIEGFGSVGAGLAKELAAWGAPIVGVSNRCGAVFNEKGLDLDEVTGSKEQLGDEWVTRPGNWDQIARDELHQLEMDIHVPCARTHSVDVQKARAIGCKAMVPAANVPCTAKAEEILFQKGVAVLPDFAVNIGGIAGSGLDSLGASDSQIRGLFLEDYRAMIGRMLGAAEREGIPTVDLALAEAAAQYPRTAAAVTEKSKTGRGFIAKLLKKGKPSQNRLLTDKLDHLRSTFNDHFLSSQP